MPLHLNFRNRGIIARVYRHDGGAIFVDISSDVEAEEVAAIMTSIADYCQMRGWHPGIMAQNLSDIQMKRQHPGAQKVS